MLLYSVMFLACVAKAALVQPGLTHEKLLRTGIAIKLDGVPWPVVVVPATWRVVPPTLGLGDRLL